MPERPGLRRVISHLLHVILSSIYPTSLAPEATTTEKRRGGEGNAKLESLSSFGRVVGFKRSNVFRLDPISMERKTRLKKRLRSALLFLLFREPNPKHGVSNHAMLFTMLALFLSLVIWLMTIRFNVLLWPFIVSGAFLGVLETLHIIYDR